MKFHVLVTSKLKHCTYKFCLKPKVTACLHGNHHALFAWYQNICEISFVNYVVNFNCTGGFDFAHGNSFCLSQENFSGLNYDVVPLAHGNFTFIYRFDVWIAIFFRTQ